MNRILIIVLFSSLFVLYLYKYSYPKVIEGATGDAEEAEEVEEEAEADEDEDEDEELTKRKRKKIKKMKRKTAKRKKREFKTNKKAIKQSSDLTKKEKKADIEKLKDEKKTPLDEVKSDEFYNNYDGMVLVSAKNYLQTLHGQIIALGQSILIEIDLTKENKRIQDRISSNITKFIGLLKARIDFIFRLRIYLNKTDEEFKKTKSELLNEINNGFFIENVSSTIEKLITHFEQKATDLDIPKIEASRSEFNIHFSMIGAISSKLVILRKIMEETNDITIEDDGGFTSGGIKNNQTNGDIDPLNSITLN
jgi:hypothetical protein